MILAWSGRPDDEIFDEFVLHVDGWLCEIKDAQIRDGLHVLGQVPEGGELINLVLAILRSPQIFGGQVNGVPGLRAALGMRADSKRTVASTLGSTSSGHISTSSGHIWTARAPLDRLRTHCA